MNTIRIVSANMVLILEKRLENL